MGTRVAGLAFAFLASVLLSRLLGLEGFGAYMIALGYASIASIMVRLGCDIGAMRFAAVYRDRGQIGLLRGFIATSLTGIMLAWTVLSGLLLLVWVLGRQATAELSLALVASASAVALLIALTAFLAIILRTLDRVFESQLYEQLLRPIVLILLIGAALATEQLVSPAGAMAMTAVALGIPIAMLAWRVRTLVRRLPAQDRDVSERSSWLKVSAVLLLMAIVQEVLNQIDLILLGLLGSNAEAGLFAAAQRLSSIATIGLVAIAIVASSHLSAAFHRGDLEKVAAIARLSARFALLATMVLAGSLALLAPFILPFYGPSFGAATPMLLVLLVGALANSATGLAGYLLALTGHERAALVILSITLVIILTIEIILIPRLGGLGAAIGSAVGLSLWNVLMTLYARRVTGIDATALGIPFRLAAFKELSSLSAKKRN